MVYTLRFFSSSKCSLFHNSNVFGSCLFTFYIQGVLKFKKNNSGAKRLSTYSFHQAHGGCYHRNNSETWLNHKRFEVLTAVHTRISLLVVLPSGLVNLCQHFGENLESSSAWKMWAVAPPPQKKFWHMYTRLYDSAFQNTRSWIQFFRLEKSGFCVDIMKVACLSWISY